MKDPQLVQVGGNLYLIDMGMMPKMFEMMSMTVPVPEPKPFSLFMMDMMLPKIQVSNTILISSICDDEPTFKFVYLFPLGKRGYTRCR